MAAKGDNYSKFVLILIGVVVVLAFVVLFLNKPTGVHVGKQTAVVARELSCLQGTIVSEFFKGLPPEDDPCPSSYTITKHKYYYIDALQGWGSTGDVTTFYVQDDKDCEKCGGWAEIDCKTNLKSEENKKKIEEYCMKKCKEASFNKCMGELEGDWFDVIVDDCEPRYYPPPIDKSIGVVHCYGSYKCYCRYIPQQATPGGGQV